MFMGFNNQRNPMSLTYAKYLHLDELLSIQVSLSEILSMMSNCLSSFIKFMSYGLNN